MIFNTQCCGVKEISGISNYINKPKEALLAIYERLNGLGWKYGILTFTEVDVSYDAPISKGYGAELAKFIRRYKLGEVIVTPAILNRNSNRPIRHYAWCVNQEKFTKWYNRHKPSIIEKVWDKVADAINMPA